MECSAFCTSNSVQGVSAHYYEVTTCCWMPDLEPVLAFLQDQFVGSKGQEEALKAVAGWLERLTRGSFSEDEEPLDENSRVYLQSYRDQFTRFSLFEVSIP